VSYGGDAASTRSFDSHEINKSNVADLEIAWIYPHAEATFHPLMANGVFYGRVGGGAIVAIDATTGEPIWIHDGLNGMTRRGMNYWESEDGTDRRLIFVIDDYLQQIDATTGKSITTFGEGGVVDLRAGLDRDPVTIGRWQSGTPGQVFDDLIILGSAPGEGYFSAPGPIRAYDVRTGELGWSFNTIPRPGEFGHETWPEDAWKYAGAANAWGEMSVDEERGIVYVPTGSSTFDYYGADRPGINLFSNSLLALDARTGERLWHFQMVHHDLWDLDNTAAPMLTTIRQNGREIDVVAQAGKSGFLYVFDRVTGEPIWPIEERPVPPGDMPGEYYHPTQPFPTAPAPFIPQRFTIEDVNPYDNVTPEGRAQVMERLQIALRGSDHVDMFSPINFDWTLHIPGANGGALFGTTTSEPNTGMVYVVGHNNPSFMRLYPPEDEDNGARGGGGGAAAQLAAMPGAAVYQRQCMSCHGANRGGSAVAPTLQSIGGRLDAAAIREIISAGNNRMPAMPHVTAAEADQVAAYLLVAAGAGGGGGGGGGGGRGFVAAANPFPPELIVQTGPARTRPEGRPVRPTAYPPEVEATPLYHIRNQWNSIGALTKPPYTTITAYDLNGGTIRWQKGFGDDVELAALGITDTGSPQMRNSVVVTASGLLFGVGNDGKLRAYDTDTGEVLWTHQLGTMGGGTRGTPVLYETDGRAYLVVAVPPSTGGGAGLSEAEDAHRAAIADLPTGYIAFALPDR
jgi:quinoprotein glucose dehydrogenase